MGPAMREAFSELHVRAGHGRTELSGELTDQAALYSVLDRLQSFRLDLVYLSVDGDHGEPIEALRRSSPAGGQAAGP
jgi:hypothetical protein